MRKLTIAVSVCVVAAGAVAVAGCGGSSASVSTRSTTTGQELKDLKEAYDQGLMTKQEYDREREKIRKRK